MSDNVDRETSPPNLPADSPVVILTADSAPTATQTDTPTATLPDASQISSSDWPPRTPFLANGSRSDQYQAVVRQSVLDSIHGHGKSCTSVEVCGVLVGNIYRDENGAYLHVNSSIRGDRAEGHAAQVTFTAETWSAIQATMDQEHGDERIVGWYHTHPGFGVFLSGMDLFIQDHFFNLPWQVAFVYDPIGGDEGMFYWKDGKAVRQPFLVEPDHLLLTSDHSNRKTAPTMAEVEAAEMTHASKIFTQTNGSTAREPLQPPPENSAWSGARAAQPVRSMIPLWTLGAAAFAVSFACTLWGMFSINHDIVVIPHHTDHAATQQTGQPQIAQPQTARSPVIPPLPKH